MSKYTAGKLCTTPGTYITDEGSVVVARVDFGRPQEEYEANASRIVACWNACEGISTEALVAMPTPFSTLLSAEFTGVVAQRDALAAALEAVVAQNPGALEQAEAALAMVAGVAPPAVTADTEFPPLTATGTAGEGASNHGAMIAKLIGAPQLYTSVSKGGAYERLGAIRGAGTFKGLSGIAYRSEAGDLFIREPECFAKRMVLIKPEGGSQ